jgi:hypothetical protein
MAEMGEIEDRFGLHGFLLAQLAIRNSGSPMGRKPQLAHAPGAARKPRAHLY